MSERNAEDNNSVSLAQTERGSVLAALGAVCIGFVILMLGGGVSGALMLVNLKVAPALPLFFPATLLWLWLFWRYVRGDGWPRSTSDRRR